MHLVKNDYFIITNRHSILFIYIDYSHNESGRYCDLFKEHSQMYVLVLVCRIGQMQLLSFK